MCCFSRPVRFVGGTKIFARGLDDGRQVLAYAMEVEIDEELAMVLPIPVALGAGDDAVSFIDLSGFAGFFTELEAAFPPDYTGAPLAAGPSRSPPAKPKLVVHDVGMFEASFVPEPADFERLDPRFRMPSSVWQSLPDYANHGFAVFRLKPRERSWLGKTRRQQVHPMAFSFPRRDPAALFFPTVHVHDGATVPARTHFDHMLYCQVEGVLEATLDWTESHGELGAALDSAKAQGLIEPSRKGRRHALVGQAPNRDLVLHAPSGVTLAELSGAGETYRYSVRACHAHSFDPFDDMRRAWKQTATTRLPALCRGLALGLAEVCALRREAWRLAPLVDTLPVHFVNGTKLWTGTNYMNGGPANPGGPGRVQLQIWSSRVEPQDVTLGFAELPDPDRLDALRAELSALLDRAIA